MTGTAETEEAEFGEIYELDVSVIPTNRPLNRPDYPDVVYRTAREKVGCGGRGDPPTASERGQPALVGTISIENSEMLSKRLQAGHGSRTWCSTPSSTAAKRRSSPRRGARGR